MRGGGVIGQPVCLSNFALRLPGPKWGVIGGGSWGGYSARHLKPLFVGVLSVSAYFPVIDIDLVTYGPQQKAATFSYKSSQNRNIISPLLCFGSGLSVSLRHTMLLTSLQQKRKGHSPL